MLKKYIAIQFIILMKNQNGKVNFSHVIEFKN